MQILYTSLANLLQPTPYPLKKRYLDDITPDPMNLLRARYVMVVLQPVPGRVIFVANDAIAWKTRGRITSLLLLCSAAVRYRSVVIYDDKKHKTRVIHFQRRRGNIPPLRVHFHSIVFYLSKLCTDELYHQLAAGGRLLYTVAYTHAISYG